MDFGALGTSIAGGGLAGGAVVWLARQWIGERIRQSIRHEYDRKLAEFKSELRSESATELERLKADLRIAASEREIKAQALHEKTVETLAGIFRRMDRLRVAVQRYTLLQGHTAERDERRDHVNEALGQLGEFYRCRRIYLPEAIDKATARVMTRLFALASEFNIHVHSEGAPQQDRTKKWIQITETFGKEIPAAIDSLANDYRRLLGHSEVEKLPPQRLSG